MLETLKKLNFLISKRKRKGLGIARALYQDPEVLILDEATSALDSDTETNVMKSIVNLKGQKTILIIAHRLKSLVGCDNVYKIKKGNILLDN